MEAQASDNLDNEQPPPRQRQDADSAEDMANKANMNVRDEARALRDKVTEKVNQASSRKHDKLAERNEAQQSQHSARDLTDRVNRVTDAANHGLGEEARLQKEKDHRPFETRD